MVPRVLTLVLALSAASLPALAQGTQGNGPAGQEMRRCVQGVLSQLARAQAPETQVGPTVTSQCDRQLRATLQESISTGEAGNCTVDSCLAIARQRTTEQAVASYRAFRR